MTGDERIASGADVLLPPEERPIRWSNSLLWRVSFFIAVATVTAGLLQLLVSTRGWRQLVDELEQQAYWDTAADLAEQIQPVLDAGADEEQIKRELFQLSRMNPKCDIVLLDENGNIRFSIPYGETLRRTTISLAPIRIALEPRIPRLPLYGDDPFTSDGRKIFSVAPIQLEGKPGYLYVSLASAMFEFFIRNSGQFYLARTIVAGLVISALFSFSVGLLLFTQLGRRFRELSTVIREFQQGNFSRRAKISRDDEIDRLAYAFNSMANVIVRNVEQLKDKDRIRRELVANISHDLRGPVTSMLGYVQTLLDRPGLNDETRRFLRVVLESAETQNRMVDDLFDLASLEANEQYAKKDDCSIGSIVDSVRALAVPSAEQRQIALETEVEAGLPLLFADARLLQRVIANLTTNSIRYTPAGGSVRIAVARTAKGVLVSVADTGMGILPEDLPHVFEPFYRSAKHRPGDPGGTGLGLAIVRKLLELHGSAPQIASEPGKGTSISFELPVEDV